jgi:RNA polymerase sigma-70 factor (ECF subfamily)
MSDAATITQLILRHRHGVVGFLYSIVPDYHAVEDVFQEVCMVALQKAADFQDGTNFAGWVRAIARNKVREHLRRRTGTLLDDAFFDGLDRAFDEASSELHPDSRKEALRRCLDQLPEGSRELLLWRYDEGQTPVSIGSRIGRSRVAVNSLLQRIRETLKTCVERRVVEGRVG